MENSEIAFLVFTDVLLTHEQFNLIFSSTVKGTYTVWIYSGVKVYGFRL